MSASQGDPQTETAAESRAAQNFNTKCGLHRQGCYNSPLPRYKSASDNWSPDVGKASVKNNRRRVFHLSRRNSVGLAKFYENERAEAQNRRDLDSDNPALTGFNASHAGFDAGYTIFQAGNAGVHLLNHTFQAGYPGTEIGRRRCGLHGVTPFCLVLETLNYPYP